MRAKPARRGARAERVKQRRPRRPLPPWLRDQRTVMLIVLGVVAAALYAVLVPVHATVYGAPVPATMLLGAGAVAAPLIALKRPTIAIVVFTASAALSPLTVARDHPLGAPWPWSVPMIIAFAVCLLAVTVPHGWRLGLILLGAGTAAGLIVALMIPSIPSANDLIVTTSISAGVYLIAVLLAGRLRLGAELSSQRALTAQEQGRRELVEERTRIARELHDVVAHGMSLIQVQASTARYRLPDLADEPAAEFDEIAATARTSLAEMRRILGVLRTEDHAVPLAPQRGLGDIPALVETTRRAGAEIALTEMPDDGARGDVDAATQIAAYRIVQEALSNAVRHAPRAPITVSVIADAADVTIRVRNAQATAVAGVPGGHGLRGMTERAHLLGGSLEAGADPDGGWTVTARLPRHPAPEASEGTL